MQDRLVQAQVGDQGLEPGGLPLQVLEALHLVGLHAAVLVAPAMIGGLGDAQGLTGLGDRLARGSVFGRRRAGAPPAGTGGAPRARWPRRGASRGPIAASPR